MAKPMQCPSCKAVVADDAAVCPKCDTVLDASLFSNAPPVRDDEPDDAAPPPPKKLPPKRPATGPVKVATGARKVPAAGGGGGGAPAKEKPKRAMPDAPPRLVRDEPKGDWRSRVDASEWKDNEPAPAAPSQPGYQGIDPEDLMTEVKHFILGLSMADKIAFAGTIGAIISCFFPWKDSITEGDVLGLMSLGVAVFLMCIVMLVAIVIRVRNSFPNLNTLVPWLIQFGGACFCIVWCLVYVKLSWDSTMARSPIGNFERWVSSPAIGRLHRAAHLDGGPARARCWA